MESSSCPDQIQSNYSLVRYRFPVDGPAGGDVAETLRDGGPDDQPVVSSWHLPRADYRLPIPKTTNLSRQKDAISFREKEKNRKLEPTRHYHDLNLPGW